MSLKQEKIMRYAGTWCLAFGIVAVVTGLTVGVGNIVAGSKLLHNSSSAR